MLKTNENESLEQWRIVFDEPSTIIYFILPFSSEEISLDISSLLFTDLNQKQTAFSRVLVPVNRALFR